MRELPRKDKKNCNKGGGWEVKYLNKESGGEGRGGEA